MVQPSYERLSSYAKRHGVQYRTAWNWYKQGKIPNAINKNNNILIPIPTSTNPGNRAITYARVSNSQNKNNLNTQSQRLKEYATARGYTITKEVKETASGLNDQRPQLLKLFADSEWDVLIVEHKDRLTRFGYPYLEALAHEQSRAIEIINHTTDDNDADLLEDLVSIITSFMARIYGPRRSQRKTEKIIQELTDNTGDTV